VTASPTTDASVVIASPSLTTATSSPAAADETPIVSDQIGPRPGVPAALQTKTWLVEAANPDGSAGGGTVYVAGVEGTTARIILPPTEVGIGAADGWVVSAVVTGASSKLLVRDVSSGKEVAALDAGFVVHRGLLIGRRLFVAAGYGDGPGQADVGVWMADLTASAPTLQQVASPIADPSLGDPVERVPFIVSGSGKTISSSLVGLSLADSQIIDVATGKVRRTLSGLAVPFVMTDDGTLTLSVSAAGDPAPLAYVDLSSGQTSWSLPSSVAYPSVADPAGRGVVVSYVNAGGDTYVIADVSFPDGKLTTILSQKVGVGERWLSSDLSTYDVLVLLSDGLGSALHDAAGQVPAALLDRGGAIQDGAFIVGAK
jgi:hypothetical protein